MSDKLYTTENSEYLLNNKTWHIEDSAWKASKINRFIKKNKLELKEVVEVGCGAGEILKQLQILNKSITYYGFDIAPDVKPFWLERENAKLLFEQSDLFENSKKYDLMLMIDVFEHVSDYIGFIKKSKNIATYKIYHIPLEISVSSVLRKTFSKARKNLGHIHYYTKETALNTLIDSGLEVIDFEFTAGAVELNNESDWKKKLMSYPRKLLFLINKDFTVRTLGGYSLLVLTK